jgi:hypothetical protein
MRFNPHLARTTLLLAFVAMIVAGGCQKEPGPNQPSEPSAGTRQVTVELTGLT